MKTINERTNALLNSLISVPVCAPRDGDNAWFPSVDLIETKQDYVFKVDLPGLRPEDIQFEVDNAGIAISGNRSSGFTAGRRLRIERPSGAFVRRLPLPGDATGEVLGSICDGVLELRIPKTPVEESRAGGEVDNSVSSRSGQQSDYEFEGVAP